MKDEIKYNKEKEIFLNRMKKATQERLWEIEVELQLHQRWEIVDSNKKVTIQGQEFPIRTYVSALKKDKNNLKNRIDLITEKRDEEVGLRKDK